MSQRGVFPWLPACLAIAGITHLSSMLMLPRLAPRDAFQRLAAVTDVNKVSLLPQPRPGDDVLVYPDPSMATGVCRFDLNSGPLRLQAVVAGDNLLSISFHDRGGIVFYAMTDRASVRGRIDILLGLRRQLDQIEANDQSDEPSQDLRLPAPAREGFIVLRALAERPSDMARARAQIQSIVCGPEGG